MELGKVDKSATLRGFLDTAAELCLGCWTSFLVSLGDGVGLSVR